MRATLRDRILEAEKLSHPLVIITTSGTRCEGVPTEVGVDFVEIQTDERPVDLALFHVESVAW